MDDFKNEEVIAKIEQINLVLLEKSIVSEKNKSGGISLLAGKSGITLYYALNYQIFGKEIFKKHLLSSLNETVESITSSNSLLLSHCSGISGWGWLLDYLTKNHLIGNDFEDYIAEVEDVLEEKLTDLLLASNFDLLHGALGIGLFLIKRQKNAAICKILYSLDQCAKKTEKEIKWTRYDKYIMHDTIYDFGLAHGNAGILYFLTKCYQAGILKDLCKSLIEGLLRFYINNIQDIEKFKSYYPASVRIGDYTIPDEHGYTSRLAWCYGDLGILYTLYNVASILNNEAYAEMFLNMLHNTVTRKDFKETNITDAAFCHGSSGVGFMYLKLYKLTGSELLKQAYLFWLDATLAFGGSKKAGSAGYLFDLGSQGGIAINYDFLSGLEGVGAFLLSSTKNGTEIMSKWEEILFLC
ncbi:MAG: lanthionine synthetase LanC family protein [Mucilaginibacter sp.]|uniref:lanthionine synthetase LanC family protein n=1 Tax=Mucilaginibacter sp. TaxID=1882438 RepID=UPI0032633B83